MGDTGCGDAGPSRSSVGLRGAASWCPGAASRPRPHRAAGRSTGRRPASPGDVPLADQITGRADEGYNCGLALVGYNSLGGRGGNANMAWVGRLRLRHRRRRRRGRRAATRPPGHVRTLHGAGSDATRSRPSHAVDAPDRSLLVTGPLRPLQLQRHRPPPRRSTSGTCATAAHPRLLRRCSSRGTSTTSRSRADGKPLWSTLPLQAVDLTDLAPPAVPRQPSRTTWAAGGPAVPLSPTRPGPRPTARGSTSAASSARRRGAPRHRHRATGRRARPTSSAACRGPGHSIRPMTIDGQPYLARTRTRASSTPRPRAACPTC